MTVLPIRQDSTAAEHTPYDSVWAGTEVPAQQPQGVERVMLPHDKIYVVLAVVLIIWFGIMALLVRNDRRLKRLEQSLEAGIVQEPDRL